MGSMPIIEFEEVDKDNWVWGVLQRAYKTILTRLHEYSMKTSKTIGPRMHTL